MKCNNIQLPMKIFKCISLIYIFVCLYSCKEEIENQEIPNLCKIKIFTYGNIDGFDLLGISINASSSTSLLFNEENNRLGNACELKNDDLKLGERNINLLYFDKPKGKIEISTYGIDVITKEEKQRTVTIKIQSYDNGNQIIDTTFTFHSIYENELPPPGSILDIDTYKIDLINYL